jgi:hypothetical protein
MSEPPASDRANLGQLSRSSARYGSNRWTWFFVGVALWLAGAAAHWPASLTLLDEVGYVGQARLLLEGRVRPAPDSVCLSYLTPSGEIARYPYFFPALVAPLFALSPRAVFAVGFVASALLALVIAMALSRWKTDPVWAVLVLAHPTVLIFSRTVMVDILLSALAVGAWLSLGARRRFPAVLLFALLVAAKPTGIPLAFLLLAGEALRLSSARRMAGVPVSFRQVALAALGTITGLIVTAALNVATTGGLAFSYAYSTAGFSFANLTRSGPAHALTLLSLPPLLIAGGWPFVKRREYGPLLAVAGLFGLMSLYGFVDTGRGWFDSLVLSPRLVLPTVAFLLIGYLDLGGRRLDHFGVSKRVAAVLILALPVAAFTIGAAHARYSSSAVRARQMAETSLAARGDGGLGLSYGAFKAGLLSARPVHWSDGEARRSSVILCSQEVPSYREPRKLAGCEIPGYDVVGSVGPYRILLSALDRSSAAPVGVRPGSFKQDKRP